METRMWRPEELGDLQEPDEQKFLQAVAEIKQELQNLAEEIAEFDDASAERMRSMTEQIPARVDELALLDPYQTINAAAVEQHAILYYQQKGAGWIGKLEVLRNVLVLFPILLTWIGLSIASNAYAQMLGKNADNGRFPFLLLWEQGFGGEEINKLLKFSHIAGADFVFVLAIIGLTAIFYWYSEIHAANARKQAMDLRQRVEQALWGLANLLSHTRAKTPDVLVSKLVAVANQLENQQALLQRVNREIAENSRQLNQMFTSFTAERSDFLAAASNIAQQQAEFGKKIDMNVAQFSAATSQIKPALESMSGNLSQVVSVANSAAATVKSVDGSMTAVVGKLDQMATDVASVNAGFVQSAQQVSQGFQQTTQNTMQSFQNAIAQVMQALPQLGAQIAQPIQGIFSGSHQAFADINNRILQLNQNVAIADQTIQGQLNHLNSVLVAQKKMGKGGSSFANRFIQWVMIVLLATLLLSLVAAATWYLSSANLLATVLIPTGVLLLIFALSAVIAWLGQ